MPPIHTPPMPTSSTVSADTPVASASPATIQPCASTSTHDVVIQQPDCTLFRRIISDRDMKITLHELSHPNTFLSDVTMNAFCVRFILQTFL